MTGRSFSDIGRRTRPSSPTAARTAPLGGREDEIALLNDEDHAREGRTAIALREAATLPNDARLVTLAVIAAASGCSLRTVRMWVDSGQLRATRLGRSVRIRVSDWLEFLNSGPKS